MVNNMNDQKIIDNFVRKEIKLKEKNENNSYCCYF